MLRALALPVAIATVLAASACGTGGGTSPSGPASPGATATPTGTPAPLTGPMPSETASGAPGRMEPEPSVDDAGQTDAAAVGDPGQPGIPERSGASIDDVLRLGAVATWTRRPEQIALSLPASSSCWAFAAEPVVESPTRISVRFELPEPCEAVDAARTYSIAVPDGIDASAELQLAVVAFDRELTLTLPAR